MNINEYRITIVGSVLMALCVAVGSGLTAQLGLAALALTYLLAQIAALLNGRPVPEWVAITFGLFVFLIWLIGTVAVALLFLSL